MTDKTLCNRQSVVYKITCNTCNKFYLGSTIRPLHIRIREHSINTSSSVYEHIQSCNNQSTFSNITRTTTSIISTDKDATNLRLREAYYIKKMKPEINDRFELNSYSDFLFHWILTIHLNLTSHFYTVSTAFIYFFSSLSQVIVLLSVLCNPILPAS